MKLRASASSPRSTKGTCLLDLFVSSLDRLKWPSGVKQTESKLPSISVSNSLNSPCDLAAALKVRLQLGVSLISCLTRIPLIISDVPDHSCQYPGCGTGDAPRLPPDHAACDGSFHNIAIGGSIVVQSRACLIVTEVRRLLAFFSMITMIVLTIYW
jgi:hypothetical protein